MFPLLLTGDFFGCCCCWITGIGLGCDCWGGEGVCVGVTFFGGGVIFLGEGLVTEGDDFLVEKIPPSSSSLSLPPSPNISIKDWQEGLLKIADRYFW